MSIIHIRIRGQKAPFDTLIIQCVVKPLALAMGIIDTRLKELLLEYAANISVDIMEMEIMPDHVHILMEVEPQFGIHKAVKSLKGYTSKILRDEYPSLKTRMPSLWTNSYFVSTVGGAPLDVIKQYIENQKTSQRQKDKLG